MPIHLILVVDDEVLLRMLVTDHFEDAGFEVIQAASGPEAIAILKARPDVKAVVTNVNMPGTPDGIALAAHVAEVCPDCAIVVVSGRVHPEPGELTPTAKFVPKPYDGREVVRMVSEMLANPGR